MLTLEQFGVKLKRLQENDIELVRNWRNQTELNSFMEYREHISPESQLAWFKSINNKFNYYFMIEFGGKKVGVINVKNYDPQLKFGEGGIFIGDKAYINSSASVFSTLCLLNFMFVRLNICNISRIRILKDNERAIQYNKLLGYKLLPNQEQVYNQVYELTLEDYKLLSQKLNHAATILSGTNGELKYSGDPSEDNIDEINALLLHK